MRLLRAVQPPSSPEEREAARQIFEQLQWTSAVIDYTLSEDPTPGHRRSRWRRWFGGR